MIKKLLILFSLSYESMEINEVEETNFKKIQNVFPFLLKSDPFNRFQQSNEEFKEKNNIINENFDSFPMEVKYISDYNEIIGSDTSIMEKDRAYDFTLEEEFYNFQDFLNDEDKKIGHIILPELRHETGLLNKSNLHEAHTEESFYLSIERKDSIPTEDSFAIFNEEVYHKSSYIENILRDLKSLPKTNEFLKKKINLYKYADTVKGFLFAFIEIEKTPDGFIVKYKKTDYVSLKILEELILFNKKFRSEKDFVKYIGNNQSALNYKVIAKHYFNDSEYIEPFSINFIYEVIYDKDFEFISEKKYIENFPIKRDISDYSKYKNLNNFIKKNYDLLNTISLPSQAIMSSINKERIAENLRSN